MFSVIAAEAKVSERTVRRVLSGPTRDTRPTVVKRARQIHGLAEKYGYQHIPNAAARATVTGRFQAVGMLTSRVAGHSYLPSSLLKHELDELSAQQHRPTSDLVRESLRRYLATEQLKAIRKLTVPLAEAQGFLTDEDVFEAVS